MSKELVDRKSSEGIREHLGETERGTGNTRIGF